MRIKDNYGNGKIHTTAFQFILYTLMLAVMLWLCGCHGGSSSNNDSSIKKVIASITIQPSDNKLAVGKTQQFTVIGIYSDGTIIPDLNSSVVWSSSEPTVAAITSSGMVSALAVGQSTITATVGAISGTTVLTVPSITLAAIKITPLNPTIAISTTQQFTATGAYSDGTFSVMASGVTWSSSDTSKATITADGNVKAVSAGTTVIKVTSGSISGTTTLSISPATLTSITLTPLNSTIAKGTTQKIDVKGTFSDGTNQDLTSSVTWNSSSDSIATITSDGIVSAIAIGSATITATMGSISATTTIGVSSATLVSITVVPSITDIYTGTTQFSAIGTFLDNTTQDLTSQVIWSLPVGAIASITLDGKLTAVSGGTILVNATFGSVAGSKEVTVPSAVISAEGIWEGTYTIYDSITPSEIGTYTFKIVLSQSATDVTATTSLRYDIPDQKADGQFTGGDVVGNKIDFVFKYIDPRTTHEMVNIGTATITDSLMTGSVLENYNGGYNCSYIFELRKLP